MSSAFRNALCCWASSQQSPVDQKSPSLSPPASPGSPSPLDSICICACHSQLQLQQQRLSSTSQSPSSQQHSHPTFPEKEPCCHHTHRHLAHSTANTFLPSLSSSASSSALPSPSPSANALLAPSSSPRSSFNNNSKKTSTFMLTPPSAYGSATMPTLSTSNNTSSFLGKVPKRFSLQKYYYSRNTMKDPMQAHQQQQQQQHHHQQPQQHQQMSPPSTTPSFMGPRQLNALAMANGQASLASASSPTKASYAHPYHRHRSPKLTGTISPPHSPSARMAMTLGGSPVGSMTDLSLPQAQSTTTVAPAVAPSVISSTTAAITTTTTTTTTTMSTDSGSAPGTMAASDLQQQQQQQQAVSLEAPSSLRLSHPHTPSPPTLSRLQLPTSTISSVSASSSSSSLHLPPLSLSTSMPQDNKMDLDTTMEMVHEEHEGSQQSANNSHNSNTSSSNNSNNNNNNANIIASSHFGPTTIKPHQSPVEQHQQSRDTLVMSKKPAGLRLLAPLRLGGLSASATIEEEERPPVLVLKVNAPTPTSSSAQLVTSNHNAFDLVRTASPEDIGYESSSSTGLGPSQAQLSAPLVSEKTPYPASSLSPARLAAMLEQSAKCGASQPLILDLRPHPEFFTMAVMESININLPTLLIRRFRRGGAVSSFALDSFITVPSDKDHFHQIMDDWRREPSDELTSESLHNVIVLDQDMKPGHEEFGRSASAAWTLINVLERGGGNCGPNIRLWFLDGGFDSFQAWDAGEKFTSRNGGKVSSASSSASSSSSSTSLDADMSTTASSVSSVPASAPLGISTVSTPGLRTPLLIDTSVSLAVPTARRGGPVRRESLFSLNTKSLQRPTGLLRAQTIGVSNLSINTGKPPAIAENEVSQHGSFNGQQAPHLRHKGSWLTVPGGAGSSSTCSSASMSVSNQSMDIAHSASTDHTSTWSANSGGSQGNMNGTFSRSLINKNSFSSTTTLSSMCVPNTPMYPPQHHQQFQQQHLGAQHMGHHDSDTTMTDHEHSHFGDYESSYHLDDDEDDGENHDGEQEISCILPNFLYLGPEIVNMDQVQELERIGITRILNMAQECEDVLVQNREGMEYVKIGVQDHIEADVSVGLMQAVEIIASNNTPIYVHCKAGKSRSVTATIAYMITHLHWNLKTSYDHVLARRRCMCPNIGFVAELMRMEEKVLSTNNNNSSNSAAHAAALAAGGGLVRAGSLNSIHVSSQETVGSKPHRYDYTSPTRLLSGKSSMASLQTQSESMMMMSNAALQGSNGEAIEGAAVLGKSFFQFPPVATPQYEQQYLAQQQYQQQLQLQQQQGAGGMASKWSQVHPLHHHHHHHYHMNDDEDDLRGGIRSAIE